MDATRRNAVILVAIAVLAVGAYGVVADDRVAPLDGLTSEPTPTGEAAATPEQTPAPSPTTTPQPEIHAKYDQTTVTAVDGETGEELGSVDAAIADTPDLLYTGLSETDELPYDRGMLFVHDEPDEYTYVMRNMSFGIDIVFVAPNGTITAIHEAPEPGPDEDGESQSYSGEGQYVLEVNRGWSADHGVEEGDRLEFELPE